LADNPETREKRRRKAMADLAELTHGTEGLPGTGMANASKAVTERMKAYGVEVEDDDEPDEMAHIDRLGRRIGRGLGLLVVAYLVYHLAITYIWPG
jgi:hypothetical protein